MIEFYAQMPRGKPFGPGKMPHRALFLIILAILAVWYWPLPPPRDSGTLYMPINNANPVDVSLELPTPPPAAPTKRATVGKITMLYGDDHNGTYNRVFEGHQRHAESQGHEMFVLRQKFMHGLWSKLGYLLSTVMKELEKPKSDRLQWLFWFDCDIVMLNQRIPLEIFLPPKDFPNINLIVTNDHNGLNSGGFFIRVSEWTVQFLIEIMALPSYRPDVTLKYGDQSAMEIVLKGDRFCNQTMFVPQRWFNAYRGPRDSVEELIKGRKVPANTVKRGDLQVHFAGKESTGIKLYIPFWLDISERRDWEVRLEETTYQKEINDFWNEQRKIVPKIS